MRRKASHPTKAKSASGRQLLAKALHPSANI